MRKKSMLLSVGLFLLVGLVGTLVVGAQSGTEEHRAVSGVRQVVLEPIRPGEQSSANAARKRLRTLLCPLWPAASGSGCGEKR